MIIRDQVRIVDLETHVKENNKIDDPVQIGELLDTESLLDPQRHVTA